MKDRIAKTKQYVKDHAPELVTASCAVIVTYLAMNHVVSSKMIHSKIVELEKQGTTYRVNPFGLHWDDNLNVEE